MSDGADQSLKIQIILSLLNEGKIDEARGKLQELSGTTSDFTGVTKNLTTATEGLDLKKRELLESTRLLTAQFPLLGEAARTFFNPTTAAIFGIVGSFELWQNRVDQMTESLGALQIPDLSDAIRQAQELAVAWEGAAKAIRDADDAFKSVEQSTARTTKGNNDQLDASKKNLEAQKELDTQKLEGLRQTGEISQTQYNAQKIALEQQYKDRETQLEINTRQANLSNQFNSAANFKMEGDRYKQQADALTKQYGLGQDADTEAAHTKAQKDIIESRQKSIDESRANLALLNEATDPNTGEIKNDFDWAKLIGHYGAGVTTPGGVAQAMGTEQQNINQQEAAQKELEQEIAKRQQAEKERDDLLKKAQDSYGKSETAKDDATYQNNPNNAGSVAWQNAQARGTAATQDQAFARSRFNSDVSGFTEDLHRLGAANSGKASAQDHAQARAVLTDAMSAIKDASDTIKMISGSSKEIAQMKSVIETMKAQIAEIHKTGIY